MYVQLHIETQSYKGSESEYLSSLARSKLSTTGMWAVTVKVEDPSTISSRTTFPRRLLITPYILQEKNTVLQLLNK